jgi:L-threonylcarbamoyladenylate synthase
MRGILALVNKLELSLELPQDAQILDACERLRSGEVVGVPTETVYGLAGSIESEAGLRRIFSLKERPFFDPLIVHVESYKQARDLVSEWPPLADFLVRMFWPGPLTIVLPKASHVNPLITSGLSTVALRQPAHPIARKLIHALGHPIAAPSANKFGRTSPSKAEHVRTEFPTDDLLVLDGGECEVGVESTVISLGESATLEPEVQILRPGGVTQEMLEEVLTRWSGPVRVRRLASEASPGHLKHHYMPKIPLVIVSENEVGTLSGATRQSLETELKLSQIVSPVELVLDENPAIAARELYTQMRTLSEVHGTDLLFVKKKKAHSESGGLWQAIWDRLSRAATLDLALDSVSVSTPSGLGR